MRKDRYGARDRLHESSADENIETSDGGEQAQSGGVEDSRDQQQEQATPKFGGACRPEKETLMERARRAFSSSVDKTQEMEKDVNPESGEPEGSKVEAGEEQEQAPESNLETALATARKEATENFDKYLRAVAELENFKRRTARERADLIRYAGEHLARDLVDAIDDLDRAAVQGANLGSVADIVQGVRLIRDRFLSLLERHSIKGEDAIGSQFDPAKFEAIASVPNDQYPPGTVIEQLRKAYMFKDKLLRPGQVVVAAQAERSKETDDKSRDLSKIPEDGTEHEEN